MHKFLNSDKALYSYSIWVFTDLDTPKGGILGKNRKPLKKIKEAPNRHFSLGEIEGERGEFDFSSRKMLDFGRKNYLMVYLKQA